MKKSKTPLSRFESGHFRAGAAVVLSAALVLGGVPAFPGAAWSQILGDEPPSSLTWTPSLPKFPSSRATNRPSGTWWPSCWPSPMSG